MRKFYIKVCILCSLLVCIPFAFAEKNTMIVSSNLGSSVGKYFCPFDFNVAVDGKTKYGNCVFNIKYNPAQVSLTYLSGSSKFNVHDLTGMLFGFGDNVYSGFRIDVSDTVDIDGITTREICSNIRMMPKSTSMAQTYIELVNKNGTIDTNDFINNNTDDLLNASWDGHDTLQGVQNLTITYDACPCTVDIDAPKIANISGYSNSTKLTGSQRMKFLVYDKGGDTTWKYWYGGNGTNLSTYVKKTSGYMDNQEGIDINSLSVTLEYNSAYGKNKDEFTNGNGLTVYAYTGTNENSYGNEKTWDSHQRGYWIEFENTEGYLVEKPVKITITGSDIAVTNISSQCNTVQNSTGLSFTINQNEKPTIRKTYPLLVDDNSLDTKVEFDVEDTWAGINSGTISFTINEIMSGDEIIFTGETFDWNKLSGSITQEGNGIDEIGGAIGYHVVLQSTRPLPAEHTITITGYVRDFADEYTGGTWTFNTRKNCTDYIGCYNPLNIKIWSNGDLVVPLGKTYTGKNIVVTGTMSPYPYLTGDSGNILMCGPVDTAVTLAGIKIYGTDGNEISPYEYSQTGLYITGLDYTYQSQSGGIGEYGEITITK